MLLTGWVCSQIWLFGRPNAKAQMKDDSLSGHKNISADEAKLPPVHRTKQPMQNTHIAQAQTDAAHTSQDAG